MTNIDVYTSPQDDMIREVVAYRICPSTPSILYLDWPRHQEVKDEHKETRISLRKADQVPQADEDTATDGKEASRGEETSYEATITNSKGYPLVTMHRPSRLAIDATVT